MLAFGCSSGPSPQPDAASPDLRSEDAGAPCVDTSNCAASEVCAYPLADGCSAKGHCIPVAQPTCASFTELCGCDGTIVRGGGCFYPPGFAGGPTKGDPITACMDGGP
jgi:hypothetical protein